MFLQLWRLFCGWKLPEKSTLFMFRNISFIFYFHVLQLFYSFSYLDCYCSFRHEWGVIQCRNPIGCPKRIDGRGLQLYLQLYLQPLQNLKWLTRGGKHLVRPLRALRRTRRSDINIKSTKRKAAFIKGGLGKFPQWNASRVGRKPGKSEAGTRRPSSGRKRKKISVSHYSYA